MLLKFGLPVLTIARIEDFVAIDPTYFAHGVLLSVPEGPSVNGNYVK